jgi:hypothetical protein
LLGLYRVTRCGAAFLDACKQLEATGGDAPLRPAG